MAERVTMDICPKCWHEHPDTEPCPPIGGPGKEGKTPKIK